MRRPVVLRGVVDPEKVRILKEAAKLAGEVQRAREKGGENVVEERRRVYGHPGAHADQ